MIPGTTLALGGGGALSRDVGGSGNLQQSPLQYRGSADTVQTIEGLRLNNLCAQGAYSGVYWNDGSFQEISYVTGADSAEMGQGGIRVNMVPKRRRQHASADRSSANDTAESWIADNLGDNLAGDLTYNPNNRLINVGKVQKIWDVNPTIGGPIWRDKVWFTFTFRHWGSDKTVADSFYDLDPSPSGYDARPDRGPASTTATSSAARGASPGRSARRTSSRRITTTRASTAITGASRRRFRPRRRRSR